MPYEPKGRINKRYLVARTHDGKIVAEYRPQLSIQKAVNYAMKHHKVIPASIDVVHAHTINDAKILYNIYNRTPIKIGAKRFKV